MKTPAKRNPLAWLAALLMVVVLWGCKTDRDESLTVTDSNLVARAEIENNVTLRPKLSIVFDADPDPLSPEPQPAE
jgi:hypothetical protein